MTPTKIAATLSIAAVLSGCATSQQAASDRPHYQFNSQVDQFVDVVSLAPEQQTQLAADHNECHAAAMRVTNNIARDQKNAANSAVAGALIGALLGAAIAPRGYRNELAGRGAVYGGVSAGAQTLHNNVTAATPHYLNGVGACLRARNWVVLR
jgi:uncharacterized protein YcfJ